MGEERVFVCGAGHQGLSMAAHLALNGEEVFLWNRTEKNISEVLEQKLIHCEGIVNGDAYISKVSTNLEDVICDFVMVSTPSSAHKEIAKRLAPYVNKNMIVVLNPGRTFGAIEFAEELKKAGVNELPLIAETQTIVYTCRKTGNNSTCIYALKRDVGIAALSGQDIGRIMQRMPDCLKGYFTPRPSVALTSFANVGMVLHCAPVLMNVGWIECEKVEFKYYYDGISPTVARFLEKIDVERCKVAMAAGYKIESLKNWIKRTYRVEGDDIFECIQNNNAYKEIDAPPTVNSRYIFEDVPNGLVPMESLGQAYGVKTPNISIIIDLASSVFDTDYRQIGRKFDLSILSKYF